MSSQYRKFVSGPPNDPVPLCDPFCSSKYIGYCPSGCYLYCYIICPHRLGTPLPSPRLPPSPSVQPPPSSLRHHSSHPNYFLITSLAILCVSFFLGLCYQVLTRRRQHIEEQRNQDRDVIRHEDYHPVIVGLQTSEISSISVYKYKSGAFPVEEIECSVCLNEFQEDESLRLLPRCSHAFHVSCIDTWLSSHINCPLCREPVVCDTARARPSSPEANIGSMRPGEEFRIGVMEIERETNREREGSDGELRAATSEEEGELEGTNVEKIGPDRARPQLRI